MRSLSRRMTLMAVFLPSLLALGGCAVAPPTGPTVAVMPGKGKSFEQFRADDAVCRQFASAQIGGASPAAAANHSAVGSAAVGTVLGAAAGAAIGAAAGNPAAGAAIGAGSGLAVGTLSGLGAADYAGSSLQHRYNLGYIQCMAAKGDSVPPPAQATYAYSPAYVYPAYPAYPYFYYPRWSDPFYFSFRGGWHHDRDDRWHR
jgi:Glycine-zipper domain